MSSLSRAQRSRSSSEGRLEMFESGSFALFHTLSKSPQRLKIAEPFGVKYSLLPRRER
jgi:hypothetical protein